MESIYDRSTYIANSVGRSKESVSNRGQFLNRSQSYDFSIYNYDATVVVG
jgi:hypothetical protein